MIRFFNGTTTAAMFAAAFALALAAGPARAAPDECKGKPSERPASCDDGGGGQGSEFAFDARLIGDGSDIDDTLAPDACEGSGTIGPTVFIAGEASDELEVEVANWEVDQVFGVGTAVVDSPVREFFWVQLQGSPNGRGGVNRVTLPGSDHPDCGTRKDATATQAHIQVFVDETSECGATICMTGYLAWAAFDTHKSALGDTVVFGSPLPLHTDGTTNVIPIYDRFMMNQEGKGTYFGTLSFGEVVLELVP